MAEILSLVKINEYLMQNFTGTTDEIAQALLDFPQGQTVSDHANSAFQSKSMSHPQLYQC